MSSKPGSGSSNQGARQGLHKAPSRWKDTPRKRCRFSPRTGERRGPKGGRGGTMARVGAEVWRGAPLNPGYRQRSERNALACGSTRRRCAPEASAFRLLFDIDRSALTRPPSAATLSRTRGRGPVHCGRMSKSQSASCALEPRPGGWSRTKRVRRPLILGELRSTPATCRGSFVAVRKPGPISPNAVPAPRCIPAPRRSWARPRRGRGRLDRNGPAGPGPRSIPIGAETEPPGLSTGTR